MGRHNNKNSSAGENPGPTPKREDTAKVRTRVFSHISASVLALLFVFAISQFALDSLKGLLVDGLFRAQWWTSPHPDIKLVAYNDESSLRYPLANKIPAEEFAQVLNFLAQSNPKAIILLAPINEKNYTDTELAIIGKAMENVANVYVGYLDDESLGKNKPPALPSGVKFLPGFISRDTFSYGADSVSRRVMVTIQSVPTVYSEVARNYSDRAFDFRNLNQLGTLGDSAQTYIHWQGGPGTYPLISSSQLAQRLLPAEDFKDKIVIFGRTLRKRANEDYIFTPYSRETLNTPLIEGAAHSLVTLLRDNGLVKTSRWFNILMATLICVITVNMVLFLPPWRGILFVISELTILAVFSWVALAWFGVWIDLAHPLVVICVGYYLVIPYRLVDESRKRWHYQEKSELMFQLEQLKSNFLSLVTHDLKTPLARIQGNAELILNGANPLSPPQAKSLNAIVDTTDYMSKYVQTILDFTRIESAQVPIQKTSKDINTTINEVIASKQHLAEEKNITLEADLEPLFSIKFDVHLMRRVISNLVENAIKYSPEGSTIKLISREADNWIHVSVSDQGIGIPPEEQEKVFGKFFRCSNSEAAGIKGTGLGLYLVRYFVELHEGFVRLKSDVGKGTTFTVSLPV